MKQSKFPYYIRSVLHRVLPRAFHRSQLARKLSALKEGEREYVLERVNYYNKLSTPFSLGDNSVTLKSFKKTGNTVYYFDIYKVLSYFDDSLKFAYLPGDIVDVPQQPTVLKSRPVGEGNENSVLLKLNHVRHFNFVDDSASFEDKKDKIVWRGAAYQPHRKTIIKQFHDHPMCNIGHTNPTPELPPTKDFMSFAEQLQYKFIICPEGNDVATNLKWAMSSNSLCMMSKPKYETWFMEGRLEANKHYVLLKDDYSDLIEKASYYLENPQQAQAIIAHAHEWVAQFKHPKRELLIELMVTDKYLSLQQYL